MKDITYPDQ